MLKKAILIDKSAHYSLVSVNSRCGLILTSALPKDAKPGDKIPITRRAGIFFLGDKLRRIN